MNERILKQKSGSVLIASLWIMSILSVGVTSLNYEAIQRIGVMKREMETFQAKVSFLSGLHIVASKLLSDEKPYEDSYQDEWYGQIDVSALVPNLKIKVRDEDSKINLNFASEAFLKEFFDKFNHEQSPISTDVDDFIKELLKKRAENHLESLVELLLIEGFAPEDLIKLQNFVTVYPSLRGLNIHTTEMWIIDLLIHSSGVDDFAKREFLRKLEIFRERASILTSDDLLPSALIEKLELTRSPQMVNLVGRVLPDLTVDSRTFSIEMDLENRKATAILKSKTNLEVEILSWREW